MRNIPKINNLTILSIIQHILHNQLNDLPITLLIPILLLPLLLILLSCHFAPLPANPVHLVRKGHLGKRVGQRHHVDLAVLEGAEEVVEWFELGVLELQEPHLLVFDEVVESLEFDIRELFIQ